ncbi:MAG: hypothetical protein RL077_5786 [Verrucomicrobiota bacterium]
MDFWIREIRGAGVWVDRIGGAGAGVHHDGAGGGGRSVGPRVLVGAGEVERGEEGGDLGGFCDVKTPRPCLCWIPPGNGGGASPPLFFFQPRG